MAFVAGLLTCLAGLLSAAPSEASFPGLNGKIAFQSKRSGQTDVFVKESRRDAPDLNRSDNPSNDVSPNWSPDGTKIAFASDRDGNYEIYTMNADGTNKTRLTFNAATDSDPNWSKNGAWIAFVSNRDSNNEIYVMDANGTNPAVRCTNNAADDHDPAWSPIEDKIAFSSNRSGISEDIWVTSLNGAVCSGASNLTDHPYGAFNRGPNWSPDGQRIAFYSDRDPDPNVQGGRNEEVWVMNKDGTNQTNLTKYPVHAQDSDCFYNVFPYQNTCADRNPAWSPDGTKIAFDTSRNWQPGTPYLTEIWLMNADGSNPTLLSEAGDAGPDWQPTFAPTASFSAAPNPVLTNQAVSFDAGGSTNAFGPIVDYRWDLDGDGSFETPTASNPVVSRSYPKATHVTVGLQVTNSDGNTNTVTRALTVNDRPPSGFLALSPNPALTGQPVTFDGSASTDPDGVITNYSWDLDGNGTFETNTGGRSTVTRTYSRATSIVVKLRVTDDDGVTNGGVGALSTKTLTVNPQVITAQAFFGFVTVPRGGGLRVTNLYVRDVLRGARVELTCKKGKRKACKRLTRTATASPTRAHASRTVRFTALLRKRLKVGTLVEIRVTKRNYIGKYIAYKIRRGGFRKMERCLEPGSQKPKRHCSGGEERG